MPQDSQIVFIRSLTRLLVPLGSANLTIRTPWFLPLSGKNAAGFNSDEVGIKRYDPLYFRLLF